MIFSGYEADRPRYGSTLAPKGGGHIIRKGTGGRSSVRYLIIVLFVWLVRKCRRKRENRVVILRNVGNRKLNSSLLSFLN